MIIALRMRRRGRPVTFDDEAGALVIDSISIAVRTSGAIVPIGFFVSGRAAFRLDPNNHRDT